MDYIDIFRGSGYGSQGDWWSPNLRHSEMFKHGPLAGKMSKSKISYEDYKKGIMNATNYHAKREDAMIKAHPEKYSPKDGGTGGKNGWRRLGFPREGLSKQIDIDYKDMSLKDFKNKYYEAILPNQPSKIALGNTIKPLAMNPKRVLGELKPKHAKVLGKSALGQAAKFGSLASRFAGPLAIPLAVYDYLSGSPAGEGSDKPGTKHFDGILRKKKKR